VGGDAGTLSSRGNSDTAVELDSEGDALLGSSLNTQSLNLLYSGSSVTLLACDVQSELADHVYLVTLLMRSWLLILVLLLTLLLLHVRVASARCNSLPLLL
jgi:hypothetical protein